MTHSFLTRRSSDLAARPRIAGSVPMAKAEIVILVGSEGGATWGFAGTLAEALVTAGRKVHLGAMNDAGPMPAAKSSEEHTSELQSLMRSLYAVFCLKKKSYICLYCNSISAN